MEAIGEATTDGAAAAGIAAAAYPAAGAAIADRKTTMHILCRNALKVTVLAVISMVLIPAGAALAERAHVLPQPVLDTAPNQAASFGTPPKQVAVLAGGCFWGIQGVFQHVKGVTSAVSGYSGGTAETAQYEIVSAGSSGHAEAVEITYDPRQISFGKILQIFFSVGLDPTQLNRQGPDTGIQYRSEIFATNAQQAKIASAYIAQLDAAKVYNAPIVTKVSMLSAFYPAEDYHQDFMQRHPKYPYIVIFDLPKVKNLKGIFPDLYRHDPVRVAQR